MSNGVVAGDIAGLHALGLTFQRQSGEVHTLIQLLTRELDNTTWQGTTADSFRHLWATKFSSALNELVQQLDLAGRDILGTSQNFENIGGRAIYS